MISFPWHQELPEEVLFSPLSFLVDSLAALNFTLSNYSEVLGIRLQAYFPICALSREWCLQTPDNHPPSFPQLTAASHIAFLH